MPSDMLNGDRKLTKNEKRRMRDKESRKEKTVVPMKAQNASSGPTGISDVDLLSDVEIEYVSADYNQAGGSILDEFKEIFQKVMTILSLVQLIIRCQIIERFF